jgi:hypothetical protein
MNIFVRFYLIYLFIILFILDYTFTINSFGYGSDHDAKLLNNIALL